MNIPERQRFLEGYESVKPLETGFMEDLECFFVMIMTENYCHHAPDPRETESLIQEQPYALAILHKYLNDLPFLFQPLQPFYEQENT